MNTTITATTTSRTCVCCGAGDQLGARMSGPTGPLYACTKAACQAFLRWGAQEAWRRHEADAAITQLAARKKAAAEAAAAAATRAARAGFVPGRGGAPGTGLSRFKKGKSN